MSETVLLIRFLLWIAGAILTGTLLNVLWSREQVKKDLRRKSCGPINVRWYPYPFGYWAVFYPATFAFRVTFVDAAGCIQTAKCAVHAWFHTVYWVRDDVEYLDEHLPRLGRWFYLAFGLFFIWFGLKHLATGSLTWPPSARQTHPHPISWHGGPVALLALASLCGAANCLVNAFFRRMNRRNARRWILFARSSAFIGWILFLASFVAAICQGIF